MQLLAMKAVAKRVEQTLANALPKAYAVELGYIPKKGITQDRSLYPIALVRCEKAIDTEEDGCVMDVLITLITTHPGQHNEGYIDLANAVEAVRQNFLKDRLFGLSKGYEAHLLDPFTVEYPEAIAPMEYIAFIAAKFEVNGVDEIGPDLHKLLLLTQEETNG